MDGETKMINDNLINEQNIEKGVVLYYLPDNEHQLQAISDVFLELGVEGRRLSEADLNLNIGYLAGVDGCEMISAGSEYRKPDKTFAIMHNFDDAKISEFLAAVRNKDGLRIDLKAVVTEHNMRWNCIDLVNELKREHEMMQAFMSARNALNAARQWQNTIEENNLETQFGLLKTEVDRIVESAGIVIHKGERGVEMELDELQETRRALADILQRLSLHHAEMTGVEE
jgi:hypothetical protein